MVSSIRTKWMGCRFYDGHSSMFVGGDLSPLRSGTTAILEQDFDQSDMISSSSSRFP